MKHHRMEACKGVEVKLKAFFILILNEINRQLPAPVVRTP
jgi:hypothetical protein